MEDREVRRLMEETEVERLRARLTQPSSPLSLSRARVPLSQA
jgi:hypothetical protein